MPMECGDAALGQQYIDLNSFFQTARERPSSAGNLQKELVCMSVAHFSQRP